MNQNTKTELSERIAWAKRTTDWFEEASGKTRLPGIMADAKHMPIHDLKYTTPVLVLASITQFFLNREHLRYPHFVYFCVVFRHYHWAVISNTDRAPRSMRPGITPTPPSSQPTSDYQWTFHFILLGVCILFTTVFRLKRITFLFFFGGLYLSGSGKTAESKGNRICRDLKRQTCGGFSLIL